jgi:hydroxymethylpyrimidine/phosphomethylpyrimidine kinase
MIGRDRSPRRAMVSTKTKANAQRPTQTPPIALSIAGSDSSAGAGIQADLKTFAALGVYGLTAVTCIVAELPGRVSRLEAVTPRMVREQTELLLKNFQIEAIKTGLLCSGRIVDVVVRALHDNRRRIPLVIDPVMIATSGQRLLERAAIDAYKNRLFSLATLITPNLEEAGLLLGTQIRGQQQMRRAAKALADQFGCAILLKGGHLQGNEAIDLLFHNGRLTEFSAPFVRRVATHGTGCAYSAAITAGLAGGLSLEHSIERAKRFVTRSIARRFRWVSKSGDVLDALRHSS